jgi:amidohydrolase
VRKTITGTIDGLKDELHGVSMYIHANPELAYKEEKAHAKLCEYLAGKGFKVHQIPEVPTAFKVSYTRGSGGRTFGLNSEYDALPEIGHACGHNLIAICGVGALLAMQKAMDEHDIDGTVVLLGTPAEEGAGGKVDLLNAGAYEGIGACMMLHPGQGGEASGGAVIRSLAYQHIAAQYRGKPAHAGLSPWEGVNALDAACTAYVGISAMRQQLKPDIRVQGVITDGGGTAPNIIPARSAMDYIVRAPTAADLELVAEKVTNCFEGAARQTGCEVEVGREVLMVELRNDKALSHEYAQVMSEMWDIPVRVLLEQSMGASTDFGNVTFAMPACHPMYMIPAKGGNHTHEFTAATKTDRAHEESYKAMGAMAAVGLRFLADEAFAKDVQSTWESNMKEVKEEEAKILGKK